MKYLEMSKAKWTRYWDDCFSGLSPFKGGTNPEPTTPRPTPPQAQWPESEGHDDNEDVSKWPIVTAMDKMAASQKSGNGCKLTAEETAAVMMNLRSLLR